MTKTIRLALNKNSYSIIIGSGITNQIATKIKSLKLGQDAIIITHPKLNHLYGKGLAKHLTGNGFTAKVITVPEGEQSKSALCAMRLLEQIAAYDVSKKIFIIALGGGVIGDLAGFVAAIYKRGVPYIQMPTTLLAQIDSSIGGKTGIDLRYGKNLVGAIYQPKLVIADTDCLKTLSTRQIQNGLAEAIKYGIIKDPSLFAYIERNHARFLKGDKDVIVAIIARCAAIKSKVVTADEKDVKGIRIILNFGHTIGHAIEAASRYGQYQHGEAVALGMRAAANISVQLNMASSSTEKRINNLITAVGLPERIEKVKLSDILVFMMHDKKFIGQKNRFVLSSGLGKTSLATGVPADIVVNSIKRLMI